eukprot:jgi/Psemu1/287783/fgenesh1_pg.213_\
MSTLHYSHEAESSRFRSGDRPGPPPPATPYLTKKLLTMVTSGERHGNGSGAQRQRRPRSSPVSPVDSIAEAMKHDLEELVGYIDNLAFVDPLSDEAAAAAARTSRTRTPSTSTDTNKQLFLGDDHPSDHAYASERGRKDVFRDRTNRFGVDTGPTTVGDKPGGDPEAIATPRRDPSFSTSLEEQSIVDPVGTPPMRQEPSGSPPPQEASMYFHDESLSLILSQSEDTDDYGSIGINIDKGHSNSKSTNHGESTEGSEQSPRLWSTLQQNGFMSTSTSTPARTKSISFRAVSKDPTPSKPARSASASTLHNPEHGDTTNPSHRDQDHECSGLGEGEPNASNDRRPTTTDLRDRIGTPYTRRALDRLEQKNLERKGKEWWRVRPVPVDGGAPTTRALNLDLDLDSDSNSNNGLSPPHDGNERKSLQWETNATTPLPRRQEAVRGTPHPFGRRDTRRSSMDEDNDLAKDSGSQRVVPETPVMGSGKHSSNLVLTSPESAKKLLTEAVTALSEARRERDAAREWASNIKESVHKWVEDQRELIRTESGMCGSIGSVPAEFLQQQHQAIEDLINKLRNEIRTSKSNSEVHLETMLAKQNGHIKELSRQLSDVKEQLSCVVNGEGKAPDSGHSKPRNPSRKPSNSNQQSHVDAPGSIHKTPHNQAPTGLHRTASRSERSNASSRGSQRTRRATQNGGHLIDYGNGVTKEIHADGTTVTRHQNGDVETRFGRKASTASSPSASAVMAYYHCEEEVLKITLRDGSVLYEYSTGQVERHCANGVKIIRFPDGTKTVV